MVRVPDDDKLGVLGALLDVVGDDRNVLEVQGGIDLVHHVQGRRLQAHKRANNQSISHTTKHTTVTSKQNKQTRYNHTNKQAYKQTNLVPGIKGIGRKTFEAQPVHNTTLNKRILHDTGTYIQDVGSNLSAAPSPKQHNP